MMILLMLLAAQAAHPEPQAIEPPEDIVVIARRLRTVRWSYDVKDGKLARCTIKRPSGSSMIDKMVCDASGSCAAAYPTRSSWRLAPCIKERVRQQVAAYKAEHEK